MLFYKRQQKMLSVHLLVPVLNSLALGLGNRFL
ncbi:MAG: hypothetical protein BWY42_01562 [Candidatus Omnitrophica bacterium ADurb.Bin277]|nr:MAG: hypothetical protein BWY42_01562 [Candidatus Omnitrophica bacterium ADurb.Bin277]